ncbi:hypothetical protein [uncultured Microbacterium sp.]|uniref:hypothetical protein n=1 Tax=uncultured Microbacterium sp. TaxID=191216 RepID=UPI0025CF8247|nr:hypothetical protein [uncultured Microbacterium sp.]
MTSPSAPNGPVFAAPHVAPPVGELRTAPPARRNRRPVGTWALLLSIVAGVLAPAVGGFAAYRVARGAAPGLASSTSTTFDWRILSPVRDLVLVGEVSFWAGTAIGITALVLGIVAIARRAGRGAGIAAVVVAALGPAVFTLLAVVAAVAGLATPDGTGLSV